MTRPRYADVAATLALVVALSTGAYAAAKLPNNSVSSATVKNGAIKSVDLARGSVTSRQVKDGSITPADLARAARPTGGGKLAASIGPLDDLVLTGSFQKIGQLAYAQPAGALDDVRGHFDISGGVGGEACAAGNGVEYQLVVNGIEHNPETGGGAIGSGNTARDGDGTVVPGVNGGASVTDVQTIGSEFPVLNTTSSPAPRVVEVWVRGKGCTPTVRNLRLYVTRFQR